MARGPAGKGRGRPGSKGPAPKGRPAKGRPAPKGKGSPKGRPTSKGGPSKGRPDPRGRPAGDGRGPARGGRPPAKGKPQSGSRHELGGDQVEGRQAVRELLLAGRRPVREIYLAGDAERSEIVADIVELAAEMRVRIHEVSRDRLDRLSRTDAPQGVVAIARPLEPVELGELSRRREGVAPFLVAVDGVTDPGNLGALLRIAECAGVTGVVLPRHRAVHVTPTVTKAAAGAAEHLPMAVVGGLPTALSELREAGVWVIGLDAAGDTSVHELTVAGEGVCLVLGAEGKGLSRLVRQRCDLVASIPLYGKLASLNVSAAGAIACYEVARRRAD